MAPDRVPTRYHQALDAGRSCVGTVANIDGFASSHMLASVGFDFIFIDGQHGAFDWQSIENMCWRIRSTGAAVFLRVGSDDPHEIALTLDLPADGVVVPDVASLAQAEAIIEAACLPPFGRRSVGGLRTSKIAEHDARAPGEQLCGLMIEHVDAVEEIDRIASLPGVGLLFVGHIDLGLSMGLGPEQAIARPPELVEVIEKVRASAKAHGIPFWAWTPTPAEARRELEAGTEAVLCSTDVMLLADAGQKLLGEIGRG